jgi:hypothetical protein
MELKRKQAYNTDYRDRDPDRGLRLWRAARADLLTGYFAAI